MHPSTRLTFVTMSMLALVLLLTACGEGQPPPTTAPAPQPIPSPTPTPRAIPSPTPVPTPAAVQKTVAQIVKELGPSIVHIQTEAVELDQFNRPVPEVGVGTGEVIDDQGHILTNNHVVEGARRIVVTLSDGRDFEAVFIGGDDFLDLAIIRIDAEGLVPIPIGKSSELLVGDQVIAIGHALGLAGGPTVTGGLVSALDRSIDVSDAVTMQNLIQTDAAINPGNSGGPLVNDRGEMIGINTINIPAFGGIGFAIAVDPVLSVIEELKATGRIDRGFLGASTVNITSGLAMNLGLPVSAGAGILSVAPGSPAERAGLQEADIIVSLAGKPVRNVAELDRILIGYRSGTSVKAEFYRQDEEQKLTVTIVLGEMPR